jgi:N-acetylmuramoyl-L-alanine amidase
MLVAPAPRGRARRTPRTHRSPWALTARLLLASTLAASVLTGVAAPGPDPTPPVHEQVIHAGDVPAGWSGAFEPGSRGEMVGLTWTSPATAEFQLRGRSSSGTWSEWLDLDGGLAEAPERAESTDRARFAGPAWLGQDLDRIEVRTTRAVSGLDVHIVDTEASSSGGLSTPSAMALPAAPTIISRAQWGADESWRSVNADCDQPRYANDLTYLVVHHTVNANNYSASDSAALIRGIYRFHVYTNGWCDIAYNFLVDRFGQVFEGRYGGVRETVIGGHAGGFNTNSTGVAMLGDFQAGTVPTATYNSLRRLVAFKLGHHGIDPLGTTVVHTVAHSSSRFPADQDIVVQTVVPHGDLSQTTCPGQYLRQLIPALRRDVANDIRVNSRDQRIVGDWDGDGVDTVGNFENGAWGLRNSHTRGAPDVSVLYGAPGYRPVVGDWDGNGTDTIGVYVGDTWYLRNSNTPGPPDLVIRYGWTGVTPVVGDWDGNGTDTIGIYVNGSWMLRNQNSPGSPQLWFDYGWAQPQPVVGDWDGDGTDGVGIFWDGHWNLRQQATPGNPHIAFDFHPRTGERAVAGDWDKDGKDGPGTFRGAYWFLRNSLTTGPSNVSFWF